MACRILVPWPGIRPVPPTVEARSLNCWPAREVPKISFLKWLVSISSSVKYFSCNSFPPPTPGMFWFKLGFPGSSDGKESASNAGDLGSILGSGRSPGEGNGYSLQYSCLENYMDRGAWHTPWGHQKLDTTEQLTLSLHFWFKLPLY